MSLFSKLRGALLGAGLESLAAYRETLTRFQQGGFEKLTPEEKAGHVENVIQAAARAATLAAAAPLPLLELPVQGMMVQAIARVYGVERPGKKIMAELGAAMGGGLLLRQLLRRIPMVGALTQSARVHAATLAMGYAARKYFEHQRNQSTKQAAHLPARIEPETLQQVFRKALEEDALRQDERMRALRFDDQLKSLRRQREQGEISEEEYLRLRDKLIGEI